MKARKYWTLFYDGPDSLMVTKKKPRSPSHRVLVQPIDPKSREEARLMVRAVIVAKPSKTPVTELADAVLIALGWGKGKK